MNTPVDFMAKAIHAWGEPLPKWVMALATAANALRLKGVAARLNVSTGLVSAALANTYKGNLSTIETRVRGALMAETVLCPVLGEVAKDRCLKEQGEPFRATSALRARLFHACKNCPNRKGAPQ